MTTSPAFPDSAAEADSLDQWLESGTTGSTPAHGSLADVARHFHARMASAELAASPTVPTRAISTRIAAGTARRATIAPHRVPVTPASGRWQTWTTAALVLAVAIAVAALFQSLSANQRGIDAPPTIPLPMVGDPGRGDSGNYLIERGAQQPIVPATPVATPGDSGQAGDCALVPVLYANGDDCSTGDDGFMVEVDPTAEGTTGHDGFWVIPEPPPERTAPEPPEMQPGTLDW